MNTEELKFVFDAIGAMADGAATAALWWMVLHYGLKLLTVVAVCAAAVIVVRLITRTVLLTRDEYPWVQAGKSVAEAWGAGTAYTHMAKTDHDAIRAAINAAYNRK